MASIRELSYRFKDIATVPDAKGLIDIVLSQTQRRTPTQVHPQFKISRIRKFYMRKVKYCQQSFHDKMTQIINEFPRLDEIHPFYGSLCNVLYDRDHYKLALGQINTLRSVIDRIAKDYVRLLKYADSPYKCKSLKRAAMGRMCTSAKKLQSCLTYLEEVRQHLSRLPNINPNGRTLLLAGFPNVGKSSFINKISGAKVDVQPYAFTTQSLYIGHFDYNYIRWQIIDTPGILHEEILSQNTIELQAVTALTYINASILYLIDVSETCGYSIERQVSLFSKIKELFRNKPIVIVFNKTDLIKFENIPSEKKELLRKMVEGIDNVLALECSCLHNTGIDEIKNKACDMLLETRLDAKMASNRMESIKNRLYVTSVKPKKNRSPQIPESVLQERNKIAEDEDAMVFEKNDTELLKDVEERLGGAGVFSVDLNSEWHLQNNEWKYDIMPELMDGKSVYDFVDPEIEQKLLALEQDEMVKDSEDVVDAYEQEDHKNTFSSLNKLMRKIKLRKSESRLLHRRTHRVMPRTKQKIDATVAKQKLQDIGFKSDLSFKTKRRPTVKPIVNEDNLMLSADANKEMKIGALKNRLNQFSLLRTKSVNTILRRGIDKAKASMSNRITKSISSPLSLNKVIKLKRLTERERARQGRLGEADRFIGTKKPKHLYSGKRGVGKADHR